jgi:integrase
LLDNLPQHIREIVLFLLTTGLRRNEAFGLERRRVDLETSTVSVKVKGGMFRMVLISPEAALILKTVPKRAGRCLIRPTTASISRPRAQPPTSNFFAGTMHARPSQRGSVNPAPIGRHQGPARALQRRRQGEISPRG